MVKEGYFEYNSSDDNSDNEYKHTDKKFEKILHEATITDFINCPATNQILETEFYFKVENDLHDRIEGTYESFCKEKNDEGSNILSGLTPENILRSTESITSGKPDWQWKEALGDGKTSRKVINILNGKLY